MFIDRAQKCFELCIRAKLRSKKFCIRVDSFVVVLELLKKSSEFLPYCENYLVHVPNDSHSGNDFQDFIRAFEKTGLF